ncbi:hypothetical protein AAFF_G00397030 [Aldrovandia affinis]|uniref:Protein NPAT C-terminal domain-containing protein n=1 Tax=Aldrovandia affinis TaxID=143900 RepID=A0AAD7WKT0_9TELE|nr:hypothetical protein AAFF_G00397030 [Aldrovandia affinis]
MLLPSDIARLVLGYLEQEGLHVTSQAFILESPNLKEYADHSSGDGAISTCVFSLFGKSLTTILREYVMAKATEPSQEAQVPAVMISLWKRLDITLNQIRCLQTSPALHQGLRCSEELASRREVDSRTVKTRNAPEPKSTKSRKMAHPLQRALRAARDPPPPPSHLVTDRQLDASVPSKTHTGADEPWSPESPAAPLPQSHIQQGLWASRDLKAPDPIGASASAGASVPVPTQWPGGPREAASRHTPSPVGNAAPCGRVAPPAAEGGPSEATPLATVAAAASSTSACSPPEPSPPGRKPGPDTIVGGNKHNDPNQSQAFSSFTGGGNPTVTLAPSPTETAVETAEALGLLTGLARQAAIRAVAIDKQDNAKVCPHGDGEIEQETKTGSIRSLPADTSFVASDLVTTGQWFEAMVLPKSVPPGQESSLPLMLETPPLSRSVVAMALDITPLPDSTLQVKESIMVPTSVAGQSGALTSPDPSVKKQEKWKPRANPAEKHSTHAGKARTPQSVAPAEDGTRAAPPSVTSPQSHRRMLCFEVSSGNATGDKTPQLSPTGQRPSAATFRWIKPPVLESSRAVGCKTTPEGAKGANAGDEAGTTPGKKPPSSDRKCSASRADGEQRPTLQSMDVARGATRLGNCENLQMVRTEEETECGGGTNRGARSNVTDGRNGKTPAEGRKEASSHNAANKENELEGRGLGKLRPVNMTATPPGESTPTSVRTSALPSPGCLGQIPACKTSTLIGQGAHMEQSPAPTPSEAPLLPRIPAQGRDLKEASDRQGTPTGLQGRDREARHLPQDPAPNALIPTCSPAASRAAHTLMILSRTAISPLRDSGQRGTPPSSQGRKREQDKQTSPTSLEELQLSANRTKAKRRKKLLDCFPVDLDVDKFLSSLHYDE